MYRKQAKYDYYDHTLHVTHRYKCCFVVWFFHVTVNFIKQMKLVFVVYDIRICEKAETKTLFVPLLKTNFQFESIDKIRSY